MSEIIIAGVVACLAVVWFFTHLSEKLKEMELPNTQDGVFSFMGKLTNPKLWANLVHLISSWFIVGAVGLVAVASNSLAWSSVTDAIFITTASVIAGYNLLYMSIFILVLIWKKMQSAGNGGRL